MKIPAEGTSFSLALKPSRLHYPVPFSVINLHHRIIVGRINKTIRDKDRNETQIFQANFKASPNRLSSSTVALRI